MNINTRTINQNNFKSDNSLLYGIIAVALAFASNLFAGLISTLMSTYLPASVQDLLGTLDSEQVSEVGSYVGSLFLVGWALGGFILGWLGDRWGRVHIFTASLFIFGLFTLAVKWTPSWYMLVVFRFLAGMGIGATMVLSAVLVAEIWGDRSKGRAISLSIVAAGFPIGIIGSGALSYITPEWRSAFLVGLLPLLLALLSYLILKEPDQWNYLQDESSTREIGSEIQKLISAENRKDFIVGTTIFGAMLIGLWAVFTWLPTWAQSLVGTETAGQKEGGILIMLLGGGGIIGTIVGGFLANLIGRKGALLLSFAGAFVATSLLFWTNNTFNPIIYIETAFLSLFFGISQGILSVYIPELFPTSVRSTATGIGFNAGRIITAAAVFFVGALVPILGGYGNSLFVFSLTYAIGFIVTWFGEETKGSIL